MISGVCDFVHPWYGRRVDRVGVTVPILHIRNARIRTSDVGTYEYIFSFKLH